MENNRRCYHCASNHPSSACLHAAIFAYDPEGAESDTEKAERECRSGPPMPLLNKYCAHEDMPSSGLEPSVGCHSTSHAALDYRRAWRKPDTDTRRRADTFGQAAQTVDGRCTSGGSTPGTNVILIIRRLTAFPR